MKDGGSCYSCRFGPSSRVICLFRAPNVFNFDVRIAKEVLRVKGGVPKP